MSASRAETRSPDARAPALFTVLPSHVCPRPVHRSREEPASLSIMWIGESVPSASSVVREVSSKQVPGIRYLKYLAAKAAARARLAFLPATPGWDARFGVLLRPQDFEFGGAIVLDLADPALLHLGDQLFFEPAAAAARGEIPNPISQPPRNSNANPYSNGAGERHENDHDRSIGVSSWSSLGFGDWPLGLPPRYRVRVILRGGLEEYYRSLGHGIAGSSEPGVRSPEDGGRGTAAGGALVVSVADALPGCVRRHGRACAFLGIRYGRPPGVRVTKGIVLALDAALRFLGLPGLRIDAEHRTLDAAPSSAVPARPRFPPWNEAPRELLEPGSRWLLFSDAVFSNPWGAAGAPRRRLHALARDLKAQGYRIAQTGGSDEKAGESAPLDFADLDLRGRTSPCDLFRLLALPQVDGSLSFDTFLMHASTVMGKRARVVLKRRPTRAGLQRIREVFVPCDEALTGEVLL